VDATFPVVTELLDGPGCQELASTVRCHRIALVADVVEASDDPEQISLTGRARRCRNHGLPGLCTDPECR
jgi:hypothetical protein